MAKVPKEGIHLVSTAGTGYFYTIRRNKKKKATAGATGKVERMKYDPIARMKVLFKEGKLSKLKKKFTRPESNQATEAQQAE